MSAKLISHNFTGKSLAVVYKDNGVTKTEFVHSTHPNWDAVMEFYKKGEYGKMLPLLNVANAISFKSGGKFVIKNGKVFYNGQECAGYMFERIIFFLRNFPKQYPRLVKFAENLYRNEDENVRNDLYKFLEHGGNTITDDGCFLAYKGVDNHLWSKTSGDIKVLKGKTKPDPNDKKKSFIYNGIGEMIVVQRADVCNDPNLGCERGIHAGSHSYASGFKGSDGRLVIVKINPKDVVSVPKDESYQKLRTCAYEVIAEEGRKLDEKADLDFDKQAKAARYAIRDTNGKFVSGSKTATSKSAPTAQPTKKGFNILKMFKKK
jgi:hypothetical protein